MDRKTEKKTKKEPTLTNALLDRLLLHCSVININGPSYRLKNHLQYFVETDK